MSAASCSRCHRPFSYAVLQGDNCDQPLCVECLAHLRAGGAWDRRVAPPKFVATEIRIEYTEAGDGYRGTFATWGDANVGLSRIARAHGNQGPGYSKTDVLITWADGTRSGKQYRARLDITAGSTPDLATHVRDNCEYMTGRRVPSHRTPEQFLADFCKPESKAALETILDTCEIGDAVVQADPVWCPSVWTATK